MSNAPQKAQPKTIFSMSGVSKVVAPDHREILKDIWLSFYYGAKIGVLGVNGSGKSSLLKVIAGVDKDYVGEITYQKGLRFGFLPQEPDLDPNKTVREVVEEAVIAVRQKLEEFDAISMKFAEPMSDDEMAALLDRQATLQDEIDATQAWDLDRKLEIAADALRLPAWETKINTLSGGEKRRVALCRLVLSSYDVLLLDEPTNHLDAESVAWLERYLKEFPGTVIAVTHDRYFLDNVAGWILELDRGRGIPYEGNYSSWLVQKEKRLALEKRQEESHMRNLQAEREWVQSNPGGRRKKNKARLANYEELSSKEFQKTQETQSLYIPPGPRLGEHVVEMNDISKTLGDKVLIENFSCKIPRGAIVGIIGANGAGKTTFFKMLAKEETPDSGSVTVGDTVQLMYVNQNRDSLNGDNSVWQEISEGYDFITIGQSKINSRAYVGLFNFKGNDQQKNIGTLSGGERNRVHLAKTLRSGGNFLLLDEPTNDLDVDTLRALEDALLSFPGCAMVISHDRWFLDRIATHIMAFEGESKVTFYEGSYTEYEADRRRRLGDEALQPHRIRYHRIQEVSR